MKGNQVRLKWYFHHNWIANEKLLLNIKIQICYIYVFLFLLQSKLEILEIVMKMLNMS